MESNDSIDALKNELNIVFDRSTQVRILSEYLLDELGANSIQESKSSSDVFDRYKVLYDSHPNSIPSIPRNTFIVLLSKISSEQGTRINCPGRKQGYYLEKLVEELEQIEEESKKQEAAEIADEVAEAAAAGKQFQEKDIYPILKEWLFEKDFDRVADTSSLRANGKWGNPDLVGLKIEDFYGRPEIEITTLEVKLTEDNWEQWIFEAIAHTRFANRSYFAFLYPENLLNKLDSTDIKLYAEHFGVGVLIVEISDQDYLSIKARKPVEINADDLRITEYHQALKWPQMSRQKNDENK